MSPLPSTPPTAPVHLQRRRFTDSEIFGDLYESEIFVVPGGKTYYLVKAFTPDEQCCSANCGADARLLLNINGVLLVRTRSDYDAMIKRSQFQVAGYARRPLAEIELIGRLVAYVNLCD